MSILLSLLVHTSPCTLTPLPPLSIYLFIYISISLALPPSPSHSIKSSSFFYIKCPLHRGFSFHKSASLTMLFLMFYFSLMSPLLVILRFDILLQLLDQLSIIDQLFILQFKPPKILKFSFFGRFLLYLSP